MLHAQQYAKVCSSLAFFAVTPMHSTSHLNIGVLFAHRCDRLISDKFYKWKMENIEFNRENGLFIVMPRALTFLMLSKCSEKTASHR